MNKMFLRSRAVVIAAAVAGLTACGGGSSQTNYSLGGTVTGLTAGTLILTNGSSLLSLTADGAFVFPLRLYPGNAYGVAVQTQPATLTCRVANATGTTGSSDVTNVEVTCVPNRTLGGKVTGLTSTGLVLVNGSDRVTVNGDSQTAPGISFQFPTSIGNGFAYGVTVLQPPVSGQKCDVRNGAGIATTDVSNVVVECH